MPYSTRPATTTPENNTEEAIVTLAGRWDGYTQDCDSQATLADITQNGTEAAKWHNEADSAFEIALKLWSMVQTEQQSQEKRERRDARKLKEAQPYSRIRK